MGSLNIFRLSSACAGSRQALSFILDARSPIYSTMCKAALLLPCFALKQPGRHMDPAGQLLAQDVRAPLGLAL